MGLIFAPFLPGGWVGVAGWLYQGLGVGVEWRQRGGPTAKTEAANPWRTWPCSRSFQPHERWRSCEQVACACDPDKSKKRQVAPQ